MAAKVKQCYWYCKSWNTVMHYWFNWSSMQLTDFGFGSYQSKRCPVCFYRNHNTQTRFNDVTSNVFKFIGNGQFLAPKIRVMVARVKTDKNGRQKASGGTLFWHFFKTKLSPCIFELFSTFQKYPQPSLNYFLPWKFNGNSWFIGCFSWVKKYENQIFKSKFQCFFCMDVKKTTDLAQVFIHHIEKNLR